MQNNVLGVFRSGEISPFLESGKFYVLFHSGVEGPGDRPDLPVEEEEEEEEEAAIVAARATSSWPRRPSQ